MKKKVLKRVCSTAMGALMFVCLPLSAFAREIDVTSQTGQLSIDLANETEDLILTGTNTLKGSVELIAVPGTDKTVIMRNLSLDTSGINDWEEYRAAFLVVGTGNVIIELDGTNSLKSSTDCAGLQKVNDGTLTIKDDNGTSGNLEAIGGESGAGIGGGEGLSGYRTDGAGDRIIIESGTVTASGGEGGAGIGGGDSGTGSNITIKGGAVTANGGESGAGIGGGVDATGINIIIENDAIVTATGGDFEGELFGGAGIGGGKGNAGNNIRVEGGTVTATGGADGAGIGGGCRAGASDITISGGMVTAIGGLQGAGIGGGKGNAGNNIRVEGGTVTAIGGTGGAGIGDGANKDIFKDTDNVTMCVGEVIISGGTVTAIGGDGGAGIGGGTNNGNGGYSLTVSGRAIVCAAGGQSIDSYNLITFYPVGEGAAIGEGGTYDGEDDNEFPVNGVSVEPNKSNLYTTGSITTYAAGTTPEQIADNSASGTTVRGTIPDPNPPVELNPPTQQTTTEHAPVKELPQKTDPVKEDPNKESLKNEQPPKEEPPVYTERSCIANVNVAALIAAALKADPNAKEINIEFDDNICLTPDIMKDLFADNRVAKNCMFSHEGKRYVLRINAVDTSSNTYADCFEVLKKEPGGLAGFKRMAQIFEILNVTLKELDQ